MGIKYQVNEKFFDMWSKEMSYILGFLYADGSLEDASYLRGKYVRVSSTDKYIILKIKKCLNSKHTIIVHKSGRVNGKLSYFLRIGSHKLYDVLSGLGLHPNKSLTIRFPVIPKKYLSDFVRGYFDGDGCVYLQMSKGKTKKIIIKKLSVIFTSGSKLFLEELSFSLKKILKLNQNKIYNSHRSFQLRYGTSDSVKLFKFLYKDVSKVLYLERKFKIFLKYFKLRPSRIDKDVEKILKYCNYKLSRT